MTRRGRELLDAIELTGGETVLDAGCGTGRVTETLLPRLPDGAVIALDASAAMLDLARERLGSDPRIRFLRHDLHEPLPVADGSLDAIVSTSTLHWVRDHDAVFRHFGAALRPGGQLAAEFGGAGNVDRILGIIRDQGIDWTPWTYPTPAETTARLEAGGFTDIDCRLVPRPETIPDGELEEYLRTVVLGAYVDQLPASESEALIRAALERLDDHVVDYVRLVVVARKA
jgi:trans-aconitate 2-methyltransferase